MASENILMYCVKHKGGDRQELHERIRVHSVAAAQQVKLYGDKNDLLERIMADPAFSLDEEELAKLCDAKGFTGMAEHQTEKFIKEYLDPVIDANRDLLGVEASVNV